MHVPANHDVIDTLAGDAAAMLRGRRPEPKRAIQASYAALLHPADPDGLSPGDRAQAAVRAAELHGDRALAAHYRTLLDGAAVPAPAVLAHAERLTLDPASARASHIEPLTAAGLSPRGIVALSQLVTFIAFQARLLHGLALQAGVLAGPDHAVPLPSLPPGSGFTLDELAWVSWVETVDLARASPEQLEVLAESHARALTSPYYLMLAQEPEALRQRSRLFNAVMYAPRGLPRADRELAAVAESRINGCPYCASVHARLFAQLTKQPEVIQAIFDDGLATPLDPRRRAVVDYAAALSLTPPAARAADIEALRQQGLDETEILDLTHVVAMFAWANRLMQTLGEPAPVAVPGSGT